MRVLCTLLLVGVMFLSSGCSFFHVNDYQETHFFDIGNPKPLPEQPYLLQIESFSSDSGARYKMLFRNAPRALSTDDYHSWILPPGSLLTNYLRSAFAKQDRKADLPGYVLSGQVLAFEADLTLMKAVLSVRISVRARDPIAELFTDSILIQEPLKGTTPADFSEAMSLAAEKLLLKIVSELSAISTKPQSGVATPPAQPANPPQAVSAAPQNAVKDKR